MVDHQTRLIARTSTAHHEAGHAVVARTLGLSFRLVTIKRKGDVMGRVFLDALPPFCFEEDEEHAEEAKDWLEKSIQVDFGGFFAQEKYLGRALDWNSAEFDHDRENVRRSSRDDFNLARLEARTRAMVNENWLSIKKVASALVARGTLSPKEVDQLMKPDGRKTRRKVRSFT